MTSAAIAAIGAVTGALITGCLAAGLAFFQHATTQRDEHRRRAFERHLADYEMIFVTCRSVLDAFNDYDRVNQRASDRSDHFLRQLLKILHDRCYEYCIAVDWRHNRGMVYLDLRLEENCLRLRDLLLRWLSGTRLRSGDLAFVRRGGEFVSVPASEIRALSACDYQELRIERRLIVADSASDRKLISEICESTSSLIKDLKAVMSY